MQPEAPAPAPDLCAVARSLRRNCSLLAQSLAALRGLPPDQREEAFARHLAETRALEQGIAARVEELNGGRGEVQRLAGPLRCEVEACVAEARDGLQAAAGAYGGLAADVAEALAGVRQRLDGIHRGGRMLRGYHRAAR